MSARVNLNMEIIGLDIVAKRNNKEIYLIEYKNKRGVGFVADLEKEVRYKDDKVQELRKKGLWIGILCSENIARRILEKVVNLKTDEK